MGNRGFSQSQAFTTFGRRINAKSALDMAAFDAIFVLNSAVGNLIALIVRRKERKECKMRLHVDVRPIGWYFTKIIAPAGIYVDSAA